MFSSGIVNDDFRKEQESELIARVKIRIQYEESQSDKQSSSTDLLYRHHLPGTITLRMASRCSVQTETN